MIAFLCGLTIMVVEIDLGKIGKAAPADGFSNAAAKFLLILITIVASVEFLASQARVTGSDALHYHFT